MIVFCDTSALMKLYANEQHSDWVRDLVNKTPDGACFVSQITWVEMCAALAMKVRTQQMQHDEMTIALERLHQEWDGYSHLGLDASLMTTAGELALTFGLRAYDSVQLASAQQTLQQMGAAFTFCCFDKKLTAAAAALGIPIAQP